MPPLITITRSRTMVLLLGYKHCLSMSTVAVMLALLVLVGMATAEAIAAVCLAVHTQLAMRGAVLLREGLFPPLPNTSTDMWLCRRV